MILLIYIIKTVLLSGLLFFYYLLFLRNRYYHGFNRLFLLSIPVLSFLLPVFHFSWPDFLSAGRSGSPIPLLGVVQGGFEEVFTVYASRQHGNSYSWQTLCVLLFIIISCFLLIRLYRTIRYLQTLKINKPTLALPEATLYFVSEKGTPFSFFRSIFWGKEQPLDNEAGRQILKHEIYHVKRFHTLDLLYIELLLIAAWFNPFFYLLRKELKAIHEYEADAYAMADEDSFSYASLLLANFSGSIHPLTNPFFKNQIKRRIAMITKNNKNKNGLIGRLMILPLIAVLACIFSFKIQHHFHLLNTKPIRVVIDAGHGGSFTGAEYKGVFEKNINLTIAKKIQSLSSEYNVEVIMSRETDETPGSNELRKSLEYISTLAKSKNADLFISIHANATDDAATGKFQTSKSGFEIYVPRTTSNVFTNSQKLGSIITDAIKSDYTIESELKQTPGDGGNIYILKNATVPALLIECGYIDNPGDLKYLQSEKGQEKIARDILEGIKKYAMQTTSYSKSISFIADSVPADTVTEETLKNINIGQGIQIGVDTNAKLITYTTKDGKKYVEVITPAMMQSWGSARAAEMNHPDTSNPNHSVFSQVEVEAEYPGGQSAWFEYLQKNLKYPAAAVKNEVQGEVVVEFIVKKSGAITGIHAISGPPELKEASVNVIKASGRWVPAKQNGLIVESYKRQPINYKLQAQ